MVITLDFGSFMLLLLSTLINEVLQRNCDYISIGFVVIFFNHSIDNFHRDVFSDILGI